ncbi:MqnA/MqnD/SBP family protein [Helicobacter sp. 23-1044]
MRFGKISYLNLVPFDIFIKKYPAPSAFKAFLNHHKSYPAKLNKDFLFRRIDAGFISSIAGVNAQKTNSGIVAYGAVWSVIVLPKATKSDYQSASSNALAQILGVKGEVLIGDRALRYKLSGGKYVDLGLAWWEKHHLPFVFGLLCFNKNADFYNKISARFNASRVKIPQYLLEIYAKNSSVAKNDILEYLTHIHYKITPKGKVALNRFYRALRINRIRAPRRF